MSFLSICLVLEKKCGEFNKNKFLLKTACATRLNYAETFYYNGKYNIVHNVL